MEGIISTKEIGDWLEIGQNLVEKVGDCSNFERKVNVNSVFWKTVVRRGGLTLQEDCFSNSARIVDKNDIQKANGSLSAMREKFERMLSKDFLRAGDVIGVSRGAYEHYGIYVGKGRVIHYAGETADFNGRICIHEAPFKEFLKDSSEYFVISFEGRYPVKLHFSTNFIASGYLDSCNVKAKYSPEETIKRAYSRLGECKYSLTKNNCEHFAIWCKTGSAQSSQVKIVTKSLIATSVGLMCLEDL